MEDEVGEIFSSVLVLLSPTNFGGGLLDTNITLRAKKANGYGLLK
jgi:hypothetical protein